MQYDSKKKYEDPNKREEKKNNKECGHKIPR